MYYRIQYVNFYVLAFMFICIGIYTYIYLSTLVSQCRCCSRSLPTAIFIQYVFLFRLLDSIQCIFPRRRSVCMTDTDFRKYYSFLDLGWSTWKKSRAKKWLKCNSFFSWPNNPLTVGKLPMPHFGLLHYRKLN